MRVFTYEVRPATVRIFNEKKGVEVPSMELEKDDLKKTPELHVIMFGHSFLNMYGTVQICSKINYPYIRN